MDEGMNMERMSALFAAAVTEGCWTVNDARGVQNELDALIAECERLRQRLEIDDRHSYDGIDARDETIKGLEAKVERLKAENRELKDFKIGGSWAIDQLRAGFKNFHRSLCSRFGYVHDENDWFRDQVSLEEHIAAQLEEARTAHQQELERHRKTFTQLEQAKREMEGLRVDAERYRFIRERAPTARAEWEIGGKSFAMMRGTEPEEVDAAIDAAMQEPTQ